MIAGPLFLLLNEHMGWRNASTTRVSMGSQLALAGRPDGPLALTNPDGSLGHLTLPRGFALAEDGTLFLVPASDLTQVLHYDFEAKAFKPVVGIGGAGKGARHFHSIGNLAIAGKGPSQLLYIADTGNDRVQVFHVGSLALLHVFTVLNWQPVDVASRGDWAFILDGKGQRVFRHSVFGESLEVVCKGTDSDRWQRIALDREGRIYLLNQANPEHVRLDVFTPGRKRFEYDDPYPGTWEHLDDSGDVLGRFDPPRVILQIDPRPESPYHHGIFQLESKDCQAGEAVPGDPWTSWFDRNGRPIEFRADQFLEPRAYHADGEWISEALDSRTYRCQWHRVQLLMSAFPAGTRLLISTYSNADPTLPFGPLWQKSYEAVGTFGQDSNPSTDFLVQSRPGQYLWLKIEMFGDGYGTPQIDGMRLHFPRQSYLAHLPAIYSEENSRWFLERFLSIIQTEWDELEATINRSAALFDPAAVTEQNGSLQNLASWLALPLEGEWNEGKKRRLLQAVARYYPRRGTLDGLRTFVQVYLQNMTSLSPELQAGFPVFIEGFRRRRVESFLMEGSNADSSENKFSETGSSQMAQQQQSVQPALWGPGKVGRMQLNRYSRAGEARLVSTGDPQFELFHEYAHRFQVFIPSAWICTADDERRLRRALDAEKPAQTAYELFLVEPRFRVGIQSTIGLDTILGGIPNIRLASTDAELSNATPPSRSPRGRLGYDTVLASQPGMPPALPIRAGGSLKLP